MRKETKQGWLDFTNIMSRTNRVDWMGSAGKTIPFRYKDIESEIVIKEYFSDHTLRVDVPGYVSDKIVSYTTLSNGQIGALLGFRSYDFRYQVGDIVNGLEILEQIRGRSKTCQQKEYLCRCVVDGQRHTVTESGLRKGRGCPVCSGRKLIPGINDFATVRPDLLRYFEDPEEATKYTIYTSRTVHLKCPVCGYRKEMRGSTLTEKGFYCQCCSDGVSYPNKFVRNVVRQVMERKHGVAGGFVPEKWFDWSTGIKVEWQEEPKRFFYDLYVPMFNLIIENNGEQHYPSREEYFHIPYEQIHANDECKRELALANGIEHYVELDCCISNPEYIRRSIMESELPVILGFSEDDIDWSLVERNAATSIVAEACDVWNRGVHSPTKIAEIVGISRSSAQKYLKKGRIAGLITDAA